MQHYLLRWELRYKAMHLSNAIKSSQYYLYSHSPSTIHSWLLQPTNKLPIHCLTSLLTFGRILMHSLLMIILLSRYTNFLSFILSVITLQYCNFVEPFYYYLATTYLVSFLKDFDRTHGQQMDEFKEMVREWLVGDTNDIPWKVNLINLIERLGISYHFGNEIEEQLKQIFDSQIDGKNYDLYTTSLLSSVSNSETTRL